VEIKRRLGNVWSTSATVDRVPGHNVYDLIKTSVPKQKRMAGAALRSTSGDVVGIVVSANGPNVVALPIDRALSAARALMTNGSGSHSWLGLQSISNDTGVWVDQVDETGPAAGLLQPGDRIVTVESVPVQDLDHLIYLIRQAPVGESVVITAIRGQELIVSTLVVAEVPVETEVESE
jgi:S1-C subfamily serine protease